MERQQTEIETDIAAAPSGVSSEATQQEERMQKDSWEASFSNINLNMFYAF